MAEKKQKEGLAWSDIPNFKKLCESLGYHYKSAVKNTPQFSGKTVHKSNCSVHKGSNLIKGYVYEQGNQSNKRYWIQLKEGSTVAVDLESVNHAIEQIAEQDDNEVVIKHTKAPEWVWLLIV